MRIVLSVLLAFGALSPAFGADLKTDCASVHSSHSWNYCVSETPGSQNHDVLYFFHGRMGNAHTNISPYAVFACADGWFILAVGNDTQYRRFAEIVGIAPNPRWETNADRVADRSALSALIEERCRAFARDDLLLVPR